MLLLVKVDLIFGEFIRPSYKEVSIFHQNEVTGLLHKCRPDILNLQQKIIIDVKSSSANNHAEFLKVLESRNTSVFGDYGKYVDIKIDHILFIFAGAFNGQENLSLDELRSFGIKTEFLGRVGLIYNLGNCL